MALLGEDGVDAHLTMHGANLQLQPQRFRDEFDALLGKIRQRANNVTLAGEYVHDDLPRLMAEVDWVVVPSRWWENSPLVIQEAFQYQRPVICSDIGGMAEKVTDGVDGLHFRAGDPRSLARVLERAATTPALWESLRAGIPGIYDMQTHIASLGSMYREELERRQSRPRELAT